MLSGEVQRSTTCPVLTAAIMSIRQFCKPREHERIENLESGPCSKRTFSQLKVIKTRLQNRMNEKTLASLLRIAIEGPPISEFPVADVAKLWATKKNRRLSC